MDKRIKIKPLNRKGRRAKAAAKTLEGLINFIHEKHKKQFDELAMDAILFGLTEDQIQDRVRQILD